MAFPIGRPYNQRETATNLHSYVFLPIEKKLAKKLEKENKGKYRIGKNHKNSKKNYKKGQYDYSKDSLSGLPLLIL